MQKRGFLTKANESIFGRLVVFTALRRAGGVIGFTVFLGFAAFAAPTDLSPATTAANPLQLLSPAQHTYLYEKTYVERDKVSSSSVSFTGGSPVTLAWKGTSGICTVSVKRLSDGKVIWTGTTSGTSASVVNLEIGAGYEWMVTDASKNSASATFYTSPEPPRLIKTGDMVVMRDLGGWTGKLGGKSYTVRQNQLFRGGPAKNVDDAAKEFFRDIAGLRTELDFRGASSDRLDVTGVTYVPLSRDSSYRVKKEDMDKKDRDYWPNLIETFRVIFDAAQRPAYFHCSLGKDRTGITACLALGLLGVSEADIWRDWQATAVGANVISDGTYMAGYIRDMRDYKGKSNLNEAIELYFREDLGFTADEIETFRKEMLIGYGESKHWTEKPHFVIATRTTVKEETARETQYAGFETKKGLWYAWGRDGEAKTPWEESDGTPLELAKPNEEDGWKLLVRE